MARTQAGTVESLHGTVNVIHADGSSEFLQAGDPVYADDRIITGAGAGARIDLLDGSTLTLGPDFSARLDAALLAEAASLPQAPGIEAPETLQDIMAEGGDPTEFAEPPAAGETAPDDAGHSHVRLVPSNLAVTPESGFETTPVGYGFTEPREELLQDPQSDSGSRDATDLDLHVADEAVNLVIVLDKSSSMVADPGVEGYATRFELAQDAVRQLFDAYDRNSDVNVLIVDFSSGSKTFNSGWLTLPDAVDYLESIQVGGFTDYQEALLQVRQAFNAVDDPTPAAKQSVVYFLSDGDPQGLFGEADGALTATDVDDWEAFLDDPLNKITKAYAIGIGEGLRPLDDERNQLEEVAYPNEDPDGDPDNPNPVILDESDLIPTLLATVEDNTVFGNLVTETGAGDSFAADSVRFMSLEVDGITYTYDADADQITGGGTGPVAGSVLNAVTGLGADLAFDFTSGYYSYRVPEVNADSQEAFDYTVIDAGGRTGTATFTVHVGDITVDTPVVDILGGAGIDVIYGTQGDDILNGAGGNDILVGQLGADELTGDSGADTFVLRTTDEGVDIVTDYRQAEQDVLDISSILVGTDPNDVLANIDDYVNASTDGSNTGVAVDPDGNGAFADGEIATLSGIISGQVTVLISEDTQANVDII